MLWRKAKRPQAGQIRRCRRGGRAPSGPYGRRRCSVDKPLGAVWTYRWCGGRAPQRLHRSTSALSYSTSSGVLPEPPPTPNLLPLNLSTSASLTIPSWGLFVSNLCREPEYR